MFFASYGTQQILHYLYFDLYQNKSTPLSRVMYLNVSSFCCIIIVIFSSLVICYVYFQYFKLITWLCLGKDGKDRIVFVTKDEMSTPSEAMIAMDEEEVHDGPGK